MGVPIGSEVPLWSPHEIRVGEATGLVRELPVTRCPAVGRVYR